MLDPAAKPKQKQIMVDRVAEYSKSWTLHVNMAPKARAHAVALVVTQPK